MRFMRHMKGAERRLAVLGGLVILAVALLTSADVFGRYALSKPIPGSGEICTVLFVIGIFLALGYTQAVKGNIRVEIVIGRLPWRVRRVTEFIVLSLMLVLTGLFTWSVAKLAIYSISIRETHMGTGYLEIPLWPAKLALSIGLFLVCLRLIVDMVNHIRVMGKGDEPEVGE